MSEKTLVETILVQRLGFEDPAICRVVWADKSGESGFACVGSFLQMFQEADREPSTMLREREREREGESESSFV